jgi:hypothetical protein
MGKGIDMARPDAPLHAEVLDDFKDQLMIALLLRLGGKVSIPVEEVDATGGYVVEMNIVDRVLNFDVRRKS